MHQFLGTVLHGVIQRTLLIPGPFPISDLGADHCANLSHQGRWLDTQPIASRGPGRLPGPTAEYLIRETGLAAESMARFLIPSFDAYQRQTSPAQSRCTDACGETRTGYGGIKTVDSGCLQSWLPESAVVTAP